MYTVTPPTKNIGKKRKHNETKCTFCFTCISQKIDVYFGGNFVSMFFARLWLVPSFADLCQLSKSGNLCLPESATHSLFVAWRNRTKRKRRRFQLPGLECIFKFNKSVGHPCRPSFGAILHGGFIAFLRSCWKKTNKN